MIQSNFKIVFGVEVLHSYYENNTCTCLQIIPTAETEKLFKRFGFKTSYKKNGFDLFVNNTQSLSGLFQYMMQTSEQNCFEYTILSNDINFMLFTNLPVNEVGQLTYDTGFAGNQYNDGVVELTSAISVQGAEEIKQEQTNQVVGILKITMSDILKYQDSSGVARFRISYTARVTQWQYYVINKSLVPLDNPAIAGKSNPGFESAVPVTVQTGEQALLFSSGNNLLPLSEHPKYKFDLVNTPKVNDGNTAKKSAAAKVIFKGLPNPDPIRFGSVSINGKNEVSSQIYLYI